MPSLVTWPSPDLGLPKRLRPTSVRVTHPLVTGRFTGALADSGGRGKREDAIRAMRITVNCIPSANSSWFTAQRLPFFSSLRSFFGAPSEQVQDQISNNLRLLNNSISFLYIDLNPRRHTDAFSRVCGSPLYWAIHSHVFRNRFPEGRVVCHGGQLHICYTK